MGGVALTLVLLAAWVWLLGWLFFGLVNWLFG